MQHPHTELAGLAERGAGAVVALVTGAASDLVTVPPAVSAAARLQAPLLLVQVRDPAASSDLDAAGPDPALVRAEALARAEVPEVAVSGTTLVGEPAGLLVALSTWARRLYLGTTAAGSAGSLMADGTHVAISNGSRCPVVLVRGPWSAAATGVARVLVFVAGAAECDVVAFGEQEARSLGLGLTILHVATVGESWPVAADVPTTRVLEPEPARAHRLISSRRNAVIVISAADLEAIRAAEGVRTIRQRYAGTANLVVVVPDRPSLPPDD